MPLLRINESSSGFVDIYFFVLLAELFSLFFCFVYWILDFQALLPLSVICFIFTLIVCLKYYRARFYCSLAMDFVCFYCYRFWYMPFHSHFSSSESIITELSTIYLREKNTYILENTKNWLWLQTKTAQEKRQLRT